MMPTPAERYAQSVQSAKESQPKTFSVTDGHQTLHAWVGEDGRPWIEKGSSSIAISAKNAQLLARWLTSNFIDEV